MAKIAAPTIIKYNKVLSSDFFVRRFLVDVVLVVAVVVAAISVVAPAG